MVPSSDFSDRAERIAFEKAKRDLKKFTKGYASKRAEAKLLKPWRSCEWYSSSCDGSWCQGE